MDCISAPADCCCNDIGDVEVRLRAGSLSDAYCLISKLQQQEGSSYATGVRLFHQGCAGVMCASPSCEGSCEGESMSIDSARVRSGR